MSYHRCDNVTVRGAQIMTLLNELKREFNTAIIMITHDLRAWSRICDECGNVCRAYHGITVRRAVLTSARSSVFDRPA